MTPEEREALSAELDRAQTALRNKNGAEAYHLIEQVKDDMNAMTQAPQEH